MTDYRAYIVGKDGHFEAAEIIVAPDDETAVEAAKKLVNGSGVELWDLDRKVAVLPASK
jgi:HJR/Mrr/RecB family endonuclease